MPWLAKAVWFLLLQNNHGLFNFFLHHRSLIPSPNLTLMISTTTISSSSDCKCSLTNILLEDEQIRSSATKPEK